MMDGLEWRIVVTTSVMSILMVSQCAGKARAVAAKPHQQYNARYSEAARSADSNAVAETTTTTPTSTAYLVNPYVFSAEDYDLLQNAESLQEARSIVAYEPQRIVDTANRRSSDNSSGWTSTAAAPSTTQKSQQHQQQQQQHTSPPPERKFYEVPRKRSSRIRDFGNWRNEMRPTSQSTVNQRRRVIAPTATSTTTTTTTTTTPKQQMQTPSPMVDRRRTDATTRRQQRFRIDRNKDEIIDQQAAGLMFVLNDRLPRPFGYTTEPSFTTRNLPLRQYNRRPASSEIFTTEPARTKPTVASRRTSTVKVPYYESVEFQTTRSPPIIYTNPRRRKLQPTSLSSSSSSVEQVAPTQTEPIYETIVPLDRSESEELTTEVFEKQPEQQEQQQKKMAYTKVPDVEESDYDEPPTDSAPAKDGEDRHEYNYSHVERYEEPLESTAEDEQPEDADEAGDQVAPVTQVQDLVTEGDHHHKAEHKPTPKHHHEEGEEGGLEEHGAGKHHEEADKGHKSYKNYHEHEDGEKGHHTKEAHDHEYDEKGGDAKKHHDEAGYHEEHHHGEEGEKKKAFHEKGKHNKGHSTKGEHVVHKKDAFEKKIEFYDEFHEGGDDEKEGAHHHEHHHKGGHHHKKGHHHKGHDEGHHGHKTHHDKGHHHHTNKGHHKDEGDEHHHHHEEKYGKKGGHEDAKHWHHKKGKR